MKIKSVRLFIFPWLLTCILTPLISRAQVAGFTTNVTSGCAPLNVSFTNTSTGAVSYAWNFGNGNSSTGTSPGAVFSTPGTFTITLTATAGGGGTSTATATITVFADPIAGFTTSITPSCPGQPVTFTDNSIIGGGAISTWAWDFGDGNGQTTSTPSETHAFAAVDSFPVTVIVTDIHGCSNSNIKYVVVKPAPVASFTGSPISACSPPLTVNFTNTSTYAGTPTYSWSFGDGNTSTLKNPSNTYTTLGTFNVSLTVTQGACSDTKVRTNYVGIQNIVADFNADNTIVCANNAVNFTDMSFPLAGIQLWDFGDGTTSNAPNPSHAYAAAGTYTVILTEGSAGCQDIKTKNSYITVAPSATVAFSAGQTHSCTVPFNVTFSNTSIGGTNYNWDFGDGTPPFSTVSSAPFIHTYAAPGVDSVTLTVTSVNGCVTSLKKPAYIVISHPVASFTGLPIKGCAPLVSNFNSTSTSGSDPIVSYIWDFGNGTATTAVPNVSNNYPGTGTYNVSLKVVTAAGCRDSITKNAYVKTGTKPHANFSIVDPTVCFGTNAQFTDLSTGADSAYWKFDLAEGTFSTPSGAPMPFSPVNHLFPDTGTFYVEEIVYNHGCPDTLKIDNIVTIFPPIPRFTYVLNCVNKYSVSFTDASIGADSVVWDFGDGTPHLSDSLHPTHIYATIGIKIVTLTAYNFSTGCHSSFIQSFTISVPNAQFSVSPVKGCYPLVVTFTNTSQSANTVLWKFGDGSPDLTSSVTPFLHVYFLPKLDTAKLIITDINGCKDSTTRIVTVQGPTPDFNANTTAGCAPFNVILTDASVSDSTLVQWTWNFGDGTPSQTVVIPSVNHTYAVSGSYSVTMTVTDKNGCVQTLTKPNYILPTFPTPVFVADSFACRNALVAFDASGTTAVAPAIFSWNFGDASAAGSGQITSHSFTADNTYTVKMTVTDVNGCINSIQHQIIIQMPTAAFTDSVLLIGCGVTNMQYTDHSTGLGITAWHWSFGDNASATQQNPMHAYTVPGTYTVTEVVTNSAGCTDTLSNSVVVPGPTGTFSFNPKIGCPPLTVTFTAVSPTAISYTWDFGDGTVISNSPNSVVQYTYNSDIVATPALLLGSVLPDGSFCQIPAPTAGQITVITILPVIKINASDTSGCFPLTINFSDGSTIPPGIPGDSIIGWSWNFGDPLSGGNNTSTIKNPTHVFQQPGTYQVSLLVKTMGGCTSNNLAQPYKVTAYPFPIAAFSVNATNIELPFDQMVCNNQSAGAVTYLWNFGDGSGSTLTNPSHLYTSVGVFPIQLFAANQFGCKDTAVSSVTTNADVTFPNAFTPNPQGSGNDGFYTMFSLDNDIFFPYTSGVVDYRFEIFDRWGEKVFESFDIKKGWDGFYKGKLCQQDVYIWKAYVKLNNGKIFDKQGDVTLLR